MARRGGGEVWRDETWNYEARCDAAWRGVTRRGEAWRDERRGEV